MNQLYLKIQRKIAFNENYLGRFNELGTLTRRPASLLVAHYG